MDARPTHGMDLMPESMTKDRLARLYKVCRHLEKMGVVPEGSCNRLQALPPTPAPTPGLPPATISPRVPPPIVVDPQQPGFDPVTLLPGADQIPAVPDADQIPVESTPPPPVTPSLPLTGPQLPKPASPKGSLPVWPQIIQPIVPQHTQSCGGYFTGVRPGTYIYPSSIQVDSKGRIVTIKPGEIPESADLCLTSYLVSTNANGAPYTSIQAAYDAAKVDGHDETNPAQVLVCPGVYTEDIIFDQAGIDIIAIAQDPYNEFRDYESEGITRLVGNITFDIDIAPPGIANNTCAWRGIDIDMASDPGAPRGAIMFRGTDPQRGYVSDCRIISRTDSVVISGTNAGSGSVLDLIRCGVIQSHYVINGGAPTIIDWDDGTLELSDCRVFGRQFDFVADVEADAQIFATGSTIRGDWDCAGDVVCRNCNLTGTIDVSNTNATFEVTQCEIDTPGGAGQLVTGSGTFIYDGFPWTGGVQGTFNTPVSNLETVQLESTPPGAFLDALAAATYTITTESSLTMDTDGGAQIVNLPPAPRRCGPIRIKEIGAAAIGLTATPIATDTINRGAAGVGVVVPTTGLTFVSDGTLNWETFD